MAETSGEKSEDPTPRRLTEARKDGNIAKSTDLTAAVVLLGAILLFAYVGRKLVGGMIRSAEVFLTSAHASNPTRADDISEVGNFAAYMLVTSLGPILLVLFSVGVMAMVGQVGFLVTLKPITPEWGKISPLKGIKNLFSLRSSVRLIMSLGKIGLIATVAIVSIMQDMPAIVHIAELAPQASFVATAQLVYGLSLKLVAILLILAILDYAYQRHQRMKDLRMTKQDVKDEMKQMEGDPMVKQRRARVARQLAMQRVAAAVPKADVIITNPTHYAIALQYDSADMRAPKVIAKGADFMALRIRQIATTNEVPIVERPPLARALYAQVEVGQEVPHEHYAAVAEILAYVYRVSGKQAAVA